MRNLEVLLTWQLFTSRGNAAFTQVMTTAKNKPSPAEVKESLALDVAEARARLGEKRFWLMKQWVEDVNGAYEAVIAPHVDGNTVLLDAGCSRGDPDIPSVQRAGFAVGCDLDLAGLRGNALASAKTMSPLDRMPFRDESFDVIVCKFVVEHLKRPLGTFREFARVLRSGGIVALLTPNAYSLFTLVSKLTPFRLKQIFKGRLFGGYEEDTFPTEYLANTKGRLDGLMRQAGFRTLSLGFLPGMWIFFIFSRTLALTVRFVERVQLKTPGLRDFTMYLMGVWQKP